MRRIPCEVTSDGRTVWVNGPNGLIGRFGLYGVDIHVLSREGDGHCLHCTHARTDLNDWQTFVGKIWKFFRIRVDSCHRPIRFDVMDPIRDAEPLASWQMELAERLMASEEWDRKVEEKRRE